MLLIWQPLLDSPLWAVETIIETQKFVLIFEPFIGTKYTISRDHERRSDTSRNGIASCRGAA
jgi:hypothetical protein